MDLDTDKLIELFLNDAETSEIVTEVVHEAMLSELGSDFVEKHISGTITGHGLDDDADQKQASIESPVE